MDIAAETARAISARVLGTAKNVIPRPPVVKIICTLIAVLVSVYIFAYANPANMASRVALVVGYLFAPLLVFGAALGISSRFVAGELRSRVQTAAWITFFVPIAVVVAYIEKSADLFLDYEAIVLLFPFFLAVIGAVGAYRVARGRTVSKVGPVQLAFGALGMVAVGVIWSPRLIRDLFQPPTVVEGTVVAKLKDEKPRRSYSQAVTSYQVKIEGPTRIHTVGTQTVYESAPWYYTTRDVFSDLNVNDHVRGESVAGTGTLLKVQHQ